MKKSNLIVLIIISISLLYSASSAQLLFEKSEYAARRVKLMELIPDGIAIIAGAQFRVEYYPHFQNNDFMYFAGVEIPNAYLIIDGMKKESILFFTTSINQVRNLGIDAAFTKKPQEITGIEKVFPVKQFSSYLSRLAAQTNIFYTSFKPEELMRECSGEKYRTLMNTMVTNEWDGRPTREQQFVKLLNERLPQITVKDCSQMIWSLRLIKSPAEIDIMRRVAKIDVKAKTEVMRSTRVGMYEYEIAALYEYFCKKEGAQDMGAYVVLTSGENHPYLHYHKHNRKFKDGDFIVLDGTADYHYYDTDITVSYPANGKFTPRQREIYEASNEVHKACMSLYKPGITLDELRTKAKEILRKKGLDLSKDIYKMRSMQPGYGHSVGMSVHDVGRIPGILKTGMVFANEPYGVFPDENLGVRVEDVIYITEDGCENLTAGLPREIEEIEALMKEKGVVQIMKEAGRY